MRLAGDVRCLWWSSFGGTAPNLPDGALDLIVAGDRVYVAGPDTRATYSASAPGVVIHGIRFRPGRAGRVLGVSPEALRDQRVDLQDLWGRPAASRLNGWSTTRSYSRPSSPSA